MDILIKNGRIIEPRNNIDKKGDILIEKGKIVKIGGAIQTKAKIVVNADGKIVAPGFVDMHTHLREPGREDAETIDTALRAAVSGGFLAVSAMPNTDPPCDGQAHVKFLLERAAGLHLAKIIPVGTITKGRAGEKLTEMKELREAGCLAVSDDGDSVYDTDLMRRAMEYASMTDLLVISHCEDKSLAGDGVMNEGYTSTVLGLVPIPAEAESMIVARDIQLAELTGARLHIAHVSTAASVAIIKRAKEKGVNITAEVTPHHIALTEQAIKTFDTNLKVNPPLRSEEDVPALKDALKSGVIDVIATDHAPHPGNDKEKEFNYAPFGMIGLETALSIAVMVLIDEGYLDWPELIKKLSVNPSAIMKYEGPVLEEGAEADVIIIDPEKEWVYEKEKVRSKSGNSPFIGSKMKAQVTDVIRGGKMILRDGKFHGEK